MLIHGSASGYGADRQLELIAIGLDGGRFTPLVVVPEAGPLTDRLQDAGVEVVLEPFPVLRRSLRPADAPRLLRELRRSSRRLSDLATAHRVSLVHTNSSIVPGGGWTARQAGVPHIQHVREIYAGAGGRTGSVAWPAHRRQLLRADALACVSTAVARQFGSSPNVRVVYDAIPRRFELPPAREARTALRIESDTFTVAVVGRISDWKGQAVLVRALADPLLAEIGAVALVAGAPAPGQERFADEVRELALRLGVDERVRLLGFREDISSILAAADAVAVPSTYPDSFPNTVLEAATCGVAVVAADIGGLPELVQPGTTGLLVEPGDAHGLAAALRSLADEPERARAYAEAAAVALEPLSPERLVAAVHDLYDEVVAVERPTTALLPPRTKAAKA